MTNRILRCTFISGGIYRHTQDSQTFAPQIKKAAERFEATEITFVGNTSLCLRKFPDNHVIKAHLTIIEFSNIYTFPQLIDITYFFQVASWWMTRV